MVSRSARVTIGRADGMNVTFDADVEVDGSLFDVTPKNGTTFLVEDKDGNRVVLAGSFDDIPAKYHMWRKATGDIKETGS